MTDERRLTRRSLLAGAGSGALLLAGGPSMAAARATQPRATTFTIVPSGHDVGSASVAGAGWVTYEPIRAPRRFELLGLSWSAPDALGAQVRVRDQTGHWGRWTALHHAADHGPDAGPRFRGTDPLWVGGAEWLQLRLSRRPAGLRVHMVAVTGADALLPRPVALASGLAGAPPIIPRSAWGGRSLHPRQRPAYGEVDMAFVHHTESGNHYGPHDSPAIVFGIYQYHRDVRGWNDIGYNFLVDRYGQIFEGRGGGIDQPVIGAQAQGYNAVSTGVSVIGSFMDVRVSSRAEDAVARLLAWKLTLHGVPVQGAITVRSAGGADNSYPEGRHVRLQRVSGHRDGDATDCPGNALYAQLPDLRRRVSRHVARPPARAALTLGIDTALPLAGHTFVASGAGALNGAATLVIEQLIGGVYRRVASRGTRARGGRFRFPIRLHRSGSYRLTAYETRGGLLSPPRSPALLLTVG